MRVLAEIGAGGVNGPSVCDTSLASVTDRAVSSAMRFCAEETGLAGSTTDILESNLCREISETISNGVRLESQFQVKRALTQPWGGGGLSRRRQWWRHTVAWMIRAR